MLKQTKAEDCTNPKVFQGCTKTILVSATCLLLAACGGGSNNDDDNVGAPDVPVLDSEAPAITVGDQQVFADSENNEVNLSLTDNTDETSALEVTVSSSNQKVLSDSGIVLTIDGNDASISLTPNFDEVGTATVTINATDTSDNTAQALFEVEVVGNPTTDTGVIGELLITGEDDDPILINGLEFVESIEDEDAFDHLFDI